MYKYGKCYHAELYYDKAIYIFFVIAAYYVDEIPLIIIDLTLLSNRKDGEIR